MAASLHETPEEGSRVLQSVNAQAADAEVALELAAQKLAEQLGVVL